MVARHFHFGTFDAAPSRGVHAITYTRVRKTGATSTSAPPSSASLNWSAQSGIQSVDASSATLAHAALCACHSCPSPSATAAAGETQRLSGAEISATPDADAGRDIHQSPCRPTRSAPQTAWSCRCACSRASSCRTGLSSEAAPAECDLRLGFGSFHPSTAPAPCRAGSYTNPPRRSAFQGISHPARARSEEHTSELQSLRHLVCRLLLEK